MGTVEKSGCFYNVHIIKKWSNKKHKFQIVFSESLTTCTCETPGNIIWKKIVLPLRFRQFMLMLRVTTIYIIWSIVSAFDQLIFVTVIRFLESDKNFALEKYGDNSLCFEHTNQMWEERSCRQMRQWQHWGSGCYNYRCQNGRLHILVSFYFEVVSVCPN